MRTAVALSCLLGFATVTIWCPERWPLALAQAGVLLLAAAWLLVAAFRGQPVRLCPGLALLAAAIAWGLIATLTGWTVYPFASYSAILDWLVLAAVYVLGLQVFAADRPMEGYLRAFLLFGLAVALLALIQFPTSSGRFLWLMDSPYPDLLGPFQNRNNFAAFVELLVPIALWFAIREPSHRVVYLGIAATLVAAVVASSSRAGTLLVLVEVLAVFVLIWKRDALPRKQLFGGAIVASALIAAGALVVDWPALVRRIALAGHGDYRPEILESTLAMIASRPWTGFGPGAFSTVYPAFASFDIGVVVNHAHNDWLEWAAGGGVPFALLLVAFAALSIRPAIRSIWGLGVLAVFIHALVDFPFQRLGVAGWVFGMLAALAAQPLPPAPAGAVSSSSGTSCLVGSITSHIKALAAVSKAIGISGALYGLNVARNVPGSAANCIRWNAPTK